MLVRFSRDIYFVIYLLQVVCFWALDSEVLIWEKVCRLSEFLAVIGNYAFRASLRHSLPTGGKVERPRSRLRKFKICCRAVNTYQ